MTDIDSFLFNLTRASTYIISRPKTIEDLQKKGVKFDILASKTSEEIINELFQQRKKTGLLVIGKFPIAPQISIPTISFLYDRNTRIYFVWSEWRSHYLKCDSC